MSNASLAYQKGDLITIKQSTMICLMNNKGDSWSFTTTKIPTNAIFLGYASHGSDDKDRTMFEYLKSSSPILRACKIAIGNDIAYVDAKSFFFHIQRREA